MEKRKIICPECKGNGFTYNDIKKDLFDVEQCLICNSEGELTVCGETEDKFKEVVNRARFQ
mgnify:FL=1